MLQKDKYQSHINSFGPYLGLGFQLAATMVLMLFLGKWLDEKFETKPYLMVFFLFFGAFAGIYNLIKTVISLNKNTSNNKKNNDN